MLGMMVEAYGCRSGCGWIGVGRGDAWDANMRFEKVDLSDFGAGAG